MDEETTAFASRSMAETGKPQMPSGMPYYRALPHTWLNSVSARIFGLDKEYSYRLPSVLFGILTVPLLFLLARPYVGVPVAFLAAVLLAFSEFHIITSRQARMYAPLLFFYIAFAFSTLRWSKNDTFKHLAISAALFTATISFHQLGIFAVLIPLGILFVKGFSTTPQYKLILFSIISGFTAYFYGQFVDSPYQAWKEVHGIVTATNVSGTTFGSIFSSNILLIAQGISGFLSGIWLGARSKYHDFDNAWEFRILSRYFLAVLFGSLAATGHLHGAFLAVLLLLLLYPGSLADFLKQAYKPVTVIMVLAIIVSLLTIINSGLVPGIKSLLSFPYPNWITFFNLSQGITLLFIFSMLYLATNKKDTGTHGILILLVIGLIPLIVVGIFKKWAAARYMIEAYPFMLIVSAYALLNISSRALQLFSVKKQTYAISLACLISLSGILAGHGLPQAFRTGTVQYGDTLNKAALIFPFYPDHKSPGEFVAMHRKPGDIVIAEDTLEQQWYTGNVNYWLREYNEDTGGSFAYIANNGKIHDIYVNSIVATPEILRSIENDKSQRVWIITSGETFYERSLYLIEEQLQWLEAIESSNTPVYTGKDGITQVFCLHCDTVN
ncbi:MAG: ArnT family glycosyltransferase [Gammaproteobacteria bacterium]